MSTPKSKKSETAAQDAAPSEDVTPEVPTPAEDMPETTPETQPETPLSPQVETETKLYDVDELIATAKMPPWWGAALCRAENWAPGKKLTAKEYADAATRMTNRRMGG